MTPVHGGGGAAAPLREDRSFAGSRDRTRPVFGPRAVFRPDDLASAPAAKGTTECAGPDGSAPAPAGAWRSGARRPVRTR